MATITDLVVLDARSLSDRLVSLAGDERAVQADFLLYLDALDRRRSYAELGYPSLWEYCLRALHLVEGAAARRIGAMRVLRRFPELGAALRDGRLSLTTLCLLGPVVTADNVADLVARAAYRTKAETEEIVAALRPRAAPLDGVRRLAAAASSDARQVSGAVAATGSVEGGSGAPGLGAACAAGPGRPPGGASVAPEPGAHRIEAHEASSPAANAGGELASVPTAQASPLATRASAERSADRAAVPGASSAPAVVAGPVRPEAARRCELRPVAEEQWSLRVTLDAQGKRDLDALVALLSHKVPSGDVAAIVKEALRCAVEKHGKRKGLLDLARRCVSRKPSGPGAAPGTLSAPPPASAQRGASRAVPAAVRREVWRRDGGRCTYVAGDGTRCGSRWQLELDHVIPAAAGGPPTPANLRLRCRVHNWLYAEEVYGVEHMARYRRRRGADPEPPRPSAA